VRTL